MTKLFGNKYVKGITQFIQDEHFGPKDYIDWYCEQMGLSREEYMAGYRIAMDLRLARVQESKDRDWNDPKPGPDPYETGLDDEEIEDKEAQMKKQAKMDDDDPDAYKEMPGDAEAREEGKVKTSTHTKKYHELYGDDEANEAVSESKRVYIDFLNKDKNFKQDRKYFKSWDDAVKWARKNFDKFSPDMIHYESFQLTEGVMSDLHQMAGEVKDEAEFVKGFFKKYGSQIKKSSDSIEWVKSLYQDTVDESLVNEDEKKNESSNKIIDYSNSKNKILVGLKTNLLKDMLDRYEHEEDGDSIHFFNKGNHFATLFDRGTRYQELKHNGTVNAYGWIKENKLVINESSVSGNTMITATGVSGSEVKHLKTISPYVKVEGPGVYIAINADNKEEVLDYLAKIKAEVLESFINEEKKQSTDRTPLEDDAMETGLKKKADETGVPIGIIRAVARRGLAAWRTGHRPGATQQQWAYARVNSFLGKGEGTWGGADKDLAKEVRDGGHDKKLKKA